MDGVSSRLVEPSVPRLPARLETGQKAQSSAALLFIALAIGIALKFWAPPKVQAVLNITQLRDTEGWLALGVALAVSVLFHEAGHLIAAILLNFEVVGITLGPFRASRSHGNWALQSLPDRIFSASVSAVPRDMNRWRVRMLAVIASGPATTLLTGLFSVWALFRAAGGGWIPIFFGALAQLSFFIFVLGLIPNGPTARVRNDVTLFISIWRNAGESEEIRLYHRSMQLQIAGVRPRDYPRPLIERLAVAQGRFDAMLLFAHTVANWALDSGKIATAGEWIQREEDLAAHCDSQLQNLALARSACFAITFGDSLDAARTKFAGVQWNTLSPRCFVHRSKAGYWLSHGNVGEALAEIARSESALPKRLPLYQFEHGLLARLHARAVASRPPASPLWRANPRAVSSPIGLNPMLS